MADDRRARPLVHPAVRWAFAVVPFATLAGVLRQLPEWRGRGAMPWSHAAADAAVLFGLLGLHAFSYVRWSEVAPNRMLVNEFLTRTWFVLFGLAVVGLNADTGGVYLALASGLAVASWCVHYTVLRSQGRYRALENLAQHGLFLVGLALAILVALRFAE
jgi:hypothetical protein